MIDATATEDTGLNLPRKLLVLAVNTAMIAELGLAMYLADKQPDLFTPVFCKVFFACLLPTLALGWIGGRILRRREGR